MELPNQKEEREYDNKDKRQKNWKIFRSKTSKLNFINMVVAYRFEGYMGHGCTPDWFISDWNNYIKIKSDKWPKYVVFAPNDEQLDNWSPCMLISCTTDGAKYAAIGPGMYHVDKDMKVINKAGLSGEYLSYKLVKEDDYINRMVSIAKSYYGKIDEQLKEQNLKAETKQLAVDFVSSYFRL